MRDSENKNILATVAASAFVGRESELAMLLSRARAETDGENERRGLLLLSAPVLGASELLRQVYDRLFFEQDEVIPVYFALKRSDCNARQAAVRFARAFLQQTIAFCRRDAKTTHAAPSIFDAAESVLQTDAHRIDRIIAAFQSENQTDERAFVKACLSAPAHAASQGARLFLMFDNLHEAAGFAPAAEADFIEHVREIYARAPISSVFSGHRRFVYGAMQNGETAFETTELEPLDFGDAGILAEKLSEKHAVKINEQTRDLIAVETAGNPFFIKNLFTRARRANVDLDSFRAVGNVYTDEIFGGAHGKFYDAAFDEIAPDNVEAQKAIVELLSESLTNQAAKAPVENWKTRLSAANLSGEDFHRALRLLNEREIVRVSSNLIEAMPENRILSDYVRARMRLESGGEARALVVGEALSEFIKSAPRAMARFYRKTSALNLRELLSFFDGQTAPAVFFDYSIFANELKGVSDEEIELYLATEKDAEKILLPQIVYAAHAEAFYPPLAQIAERERAAVGFGFDAPAQTEENQTVWLAAQVDSKLEATGETTEFWCDRLEMVAIACNFSRYKIWLVAPEGFAPDAIEILERRNAHGSSRKQFDLLAKSLKAENIIGEKTKADEYEIVVPMGDDTELIAAHAVEEVARRNDFKPKAINQIKTALVEACINATEHSLSPDRRIYQKFTVEDDRIVITISNRGVRLGDKKAVEFTPDDGRRGWGLRLMRTLMDEVKFEQVDDGTRITMVKRR